jgi:hypothetical protein
LLLCWRCQVRQLEWFALRRKRRPVSNSTHTHTSINTALGWRVRRQL